VAYNAGTAFLQIVPSFEGIEDDLKRGSRKIAAELNKSVSAALPDGVRKGVDTVARDMPDRGRSAGDSFAGHFTDSLSRRLKAAARALPDVEVGANTSPLRAELTNIRKRLLALSDQEINVDLDADTAIAAADRLSQRLRRLGEETPNVRNKVDISQARDEIDRWVQMVRAGGESAAVERQRVLAEQGRIHQQALDEDLRRERVSRKEMGRLYEQALAEDHKRTRKAAQDAARAAEEAFDKTWAGRIQGLIGKAFTLTPDHGVGAARNASEQLARDVRAELDDLRGKRIGVDIDTTEAVAKVTHLRQQLTELARTTPNVQVQADSMAAATELARVQLLAERLDGRNVDLKIDADASGLDQMVNRTNFAMSRIESLTAIGLSMGTVMVPAAGAAASAIGFIGTAAAASGAAIGSLVLGFWGIGEAVKQMNNLDLDAEKSAVALAQANNRVASAQEAVASAERSLANARAQSSAGARRAARQVVDAERALADARTDASVVVRRSLEQVQVAEERYTLAQQDAREARLALTDAYRDAVNAMAELDSQVKRNSLDQRQAVLDLREAKEELDKYLMNPRATEEEREQARITYERQVQQIEDLKRKGDELSRQQVESARKGVEGSDQMVSARERIAEADKRESQAQKDLVAARQAVQQAQVDSARKVADAQRRLGEAHESQAEQARSSASQVAQAQQGLVAAQRNLQQAMSKTEVAGGESFQNLRDAMSRLTPTGQRFAEFIFGLRDEFDELRKSSSDNLLPGVQRAIESLLPSLPKIADYFGRVAKAVGDLFAETADFLRLDSTWRRFFAHMDTRTVPTLQQFYNITRDLATGLLGLYLAFTPFNDDIGGGLEDMMARFAKWSAELGTNPGFQKFLGYIRDNGPKVMDLLGEMVEFVQRFVQAAAPLGVVMLNVFTKVFEMLNDIPIEALTAFVTVLGTAAVAVLAVNSAMRMMRLATGTWQALTTVVTAFRDRVQSASSGVNGVAASFDKAEKAQGRFGRGMGRLTSVMTSGGFNAALVGATIGIGMMVDALAERNADVEKTAASFKELGQTYRELEAAGKSGAAVSDALAGIVGHNPGLQKSMLLLNDIGVGFDQMGRAAAGSKKDLEDTLAVVNAQIDEMGGATHWSNFFLTPISSRYVSADDDYQDLIKLRKALEETAESWELEEQAKQKATEGSERYRTVNALMGQGMVLNASHIEKQILAFDRNAAKIEALTGLTNTFGDAQSTAAQRADAMRKALENQTGSTVTAIEAEEQLASKLGALRDQVNGAKQAHDAHSTSLDMNTATGLRNRDALQDAAGAVRELYLQDIASGVPMDEATRKHEKRIDALQREAKRLGLADDETRKLIDAYGDVPDDIKTVYKTEGFAKAYDELLRLRFMQEAASKGWSAERAEKEWKSRQAQKELDKNKPYGQQRAEGGPIVGPGTKTSDDVLVWGSNGEFMQRAAAVDYYGTGFMEAINAKRIPKEWLPGFATGGLIGTPKDKEGVPAFAGGGLLRVPVKFDLSKTKIMSLEDALSRVESGGALGGRGGGGGWQWQMQVLRKQFPGLQLYSGFRPNEVLGGGSLSYHSRDGGRAVDVPPRMEIFKFIHDTYGKNTKELIWGGNPNQNIHMGRHYRFSDDLLMGHGPYNGVPGPSPHIHWAYDQGGYLPPGVSTVFNGTGKPEPVFTAPQWDNLSQAVRAGVSGGGREENHFHFKEAALDHGRLQAWANAREARPRAGRPS